VKKSVYETLKNYKDDLIIERTSKSYHDIKLKDDDEKEFNKWKKIIED